MDSLIPILTITGSDSTGGAGVQADIRTISQMGGEVLSVVTTVTMQNTLGIQEFFDIPSDVVRRQIEAIADDERPGIIKVGLIRNFSTLCVVIDAIRQIRPQWVLFSPIVSSSREEQLLAESLVGNIRELLLPLCSVVVVRERDAHHFPSAHLMVAGESHGQCNQLCSALAVYLSRGLGLEEAERQARRAFPVVEDNHDISARCQMLFTDFTELQQRECLASHDVAFYASRLGVSPRYLAQIVRRVSGKSPKEIIDASLASRIKQLLHSERTIQEIAYDLEFSSQAHLTNFFKKQVGQTPSVYRRRLPARS